MNSEELVKYLNDRYHLGTWPKQLVVSPHTYAHACQTIFRYHKDKDMGETWFGFQYTVTITIGFKLCGLMFKNIELVLGTEKDL